MAYRIRGLELEQFAHLIGASDEALAEHQAVRMTAQIKPGAPCRVTLEDAEPGETLILFNHVSHDVANPYRATHAIFVREMPRRPANMWTKYRRCWSRACYRCVPSTRAA